jgi:hypothetical protein
MRVSWKIEPRNGSYNADIGAVHVLLIGFVFVIDRQPSSVAHRFMGPPELRAEHYRNA